MADSSNYWEQQRKLLEQEKFNNSIALANSQANAMRNTQASLQAQGYGGTGYGAGIQTGINNAYLSAQASNQNDYWSKLQELNYSQNQDLQANASDVLGSVASLAAEQNSVNPFLENGLFIEQDGKYALNESNPYIQNLSDSDRIDLMATLNDYNNPIPGGVYGGVDDLYNVTGYDRGNDANLKLGDSWGVKNELDIYRNMVNNGEVKDGDLVLLENKDDAGGAQVFVYYKNNKFYTLNLDQAVQYFGDAQFRRIKGQGAKPEMTSMNALLKKLIKIKTENEQKEKKINSGFYL